MSKRAMSYAAVVEALSKALVTPERRGLLALMETMLCAERDALRAELAAVKQQAASQLAFAQETVASLGRELAATQAREARLREALTRHAQLARTLAVTAAGPYTPEHLARRLAEADAPLAEKPEAKT